MNSSLTRSELESYRDFALDLSKKAGENTLRWFGKPLEVESKKDLSPVTQADKETEVLCRKLLEERFPEHGIIGEEYGVKEARGTDLVWTLDPIDGTKSFISGLPLYTFLLSLLKDGEPVLGIIYQPVLKQLVWACPGMGAWINDTQARVRSCPKLDEAWMLCTDPSHLLKTHPASLALFNSVRLSRSWGDGYGYLLLASGKADIMVDPAMYIWDVAALKPIILEAGGAFCDLEGKPELGTSSLACAPELKNSVLKLLGPLEEKYQF